MKFEKSIEECMEECMAAGKQGCGHKRIHY